MREAGDQGFCLDHDGELCLVAKCWNDVSGCNPADWAVQGNVVEKFYL